MGPFNLHFETGLFRNSEIHTIMFLQLILDCNMTGQPLPDIKFLKLKHNRNKKEKEETIQASDQNAISITKVEADGVTVAKLRIRISESRVQTLIDKSWFYCAETNRYENIKAIYRKHDLNM